MTLTWRGRAALLALCPLAFVCACAPALAAPWRLSARFGRAGVAGLAVRERGAGTLLATGPYGSVYVGGFANRRAGAFLLARMSASGRLARTFGAAGVVAVPGVYAFARDPPRLFATRGGGVLVVGLDRSDRLVAVELSATGRLERGFGRGGVARRALAGAHGFNVLSAVGVESSGDILAVYQHEVPQPRNEPAIPAGLGEGPIRLVQLLPNGSLDDSFGAGGYQTATGALPVLAGYEGEGGGWACATTIAPDGSVLLAYEQAAIPDSIRAGEAPAVQKLTPSGADAAGFGVQGAMYLPATPATANASSSLCDGLLSLPGGGVEAAFGGEGPNSTLDELFRFPAAVEMTSPVQPVLETTLHAPVAALATSSGETLSAGTAGHALVIGGTLPDGSPDPALGGAGGERFAARLPKPSATAAAPTVELLPTGTTLFVRVGEELVRLQR